MTTTELTDEQLMEEIKKVKVERSLPENWEKLVKRRYLSYNISREGNDLMVKFFQTIGEGKISIDTWYGLSNIRDAAKEAGFVIRKGKLNHVSYMIFKIKNDVKPSFTFNVKSLDTEDTEFKQKTEDAGSIY